MASEYPSKMTPMEIYSRLVIKSTTCPWRGHRPFKQQVTQRTDSKPAGCKGQVGIYTGYFVQGSTQFNYIR